MNKHIWIKPVKRYSHKEPMFQGFIEFLKNSKGELK